MGAYCLDRGHPKCAHMGCPKSAAWEVYNTYNAPVGMFCLPHAKVKVAALDHAERTCRQRDRQAGNYESSEPGDPEPLEPASWSERAYLPSDPGEL